MTLLREVIGAMRNISKGAYAAGILTFGLVALVFTPMTRIVGPDAAISDIAHADAPSCAPSCGDCGGGDAGDCGGACGDGSACCAGDGCGGCAG